MRTRIGETFVEQRVGDRGQQQRVRAGTDREPFVGLLRGAAAPGVDDDEPPAPRLHRLDPTREVGGRAQAPVRRVGVGAEHDEEVGAVEVGHRDRDRRSEHVPGRHVARHLVDGRRAVALPRAQPGEQRPVEASSPTGCAPWDCRGTRRAPRRTVTPDDRTRRPSSTACHASSHDTSTCTPSRLTSGWRSRSGSSWS